MRILLAPDKFRGSLTARQVADAMAEGVGLAMPNAGIVTLPLADGGEGTAAVLTEATHGIWHSVCVSDPLGRPVDAGFGVSGDGQTAFVEMAQASGLALLTVAERDPDKTSTFGTGELLRYAMATGAEQVILGIGGSATNDGGIGMAAALGWQFLGEAGALIPPLARNLIYIRRLVPPPAPLFPDVTVRVACDVSNPLVGPAGATAVYGPQKGATPAQVISLDAGLQNLAHCVQKQFGIDIASVPGAGAAGGLGAGALFFLKATLQPGVDLVLDAVGFDTHLANADLVLTGEGKLDRQTLDGKLLKGVADRAGRASVPVVALCGTLDLTPSEIDALGLRAAFSVLTKPQPLAKALQTAYEDVIRATFAVCRLFV